MVCVEQAGHVIEPDDTAWGIRPSRLCQIRRQPGLYQIPFWQDDPHSLVGRSTLSGPWLADQDDEAAGPHHPLDDPAQFGIMVARDIRRESSAWRLGRRRSFYAQKVPIL